MTLRIACDLDGTVADMDAALQREAERLFGSGVDLHGAPGERLESAEDVEIAAAEGEAESLPGEPAPDLPPAPPPAPPPSTGSRPLTHAELRALWAHVRGMENFWTSLGEIEPGAVSRLAAMAQEYRWDVIFLTQRPSSAGETTQVQSQRWLQAHGFAMPSVFITVAGSRGRVADALALDAVIDDRPENCLDVETDSKAKPVLVWRQFPSLLPPGVARTTIETVYSMTDALALLEAFMTDRVKGRTLLGRLRRAIGM